MKNVIVLNGFSIFFDEFEDPIISSVLLKRVGGFYLIWEAELREKR